jgi:hypothetical protein
MRFFSAIVAALPALAAAQDFQQYQAQFQDFLGQMAGYIPNPGRHNPVAALEAKVGAMKLHILTLDNWKDTLYEPVQAGATRLALVMTIPPPYFPPPAPLSVLPRRLWARRSNISFFNMHSLT